MCPCHLLIICYEVMHLSVPHAPNCLYRTVSSFFFLKKHNSSLKAFEGMIYIIFLFPHNASLPACSVYTHHVCLYTYCTLTCAHGETDNSLKTNRRNEKSARQIDSTNTDTKFEILANAVRKRDHSCASKHGSLSRKTKKEGRAVWSPLAVAYLKLKLKGNLAGGNGGHATWMWCLDKLLRWIFQRYKSTDPN